jgi:hypothetical protein
MGQVAQPLFASRQVEHLAKRGKRAIDAAVAQTLLLLIGNERAKRVRGDLRRAIAGKERVKPLDAIDANATVAVAPELVRGRSTAEAASIQEALAHPSILVYDDSYITV